MRGGGGETGWRGPELALWRRGRLAPGESGAA